MPALLGLVALAAAVVASAFVGTSGLGLPTSEVLWLLRLPRLALAVLIGSALAMSGVGSQALLRNALADPYVLGVSGGAALGGVLGATLLAPLPLWGIMLAAWLGAWLASIALFVREWQSGLPPSTLLLTGVVFNAFAAAVITLVKTLVSATKAQEVLFWLMGQFGYIEPIYLLVLAGCVASGGGVLLANSRALDVLVQGDEVAITLGVDPRRVRRRVYLALTVMIASVVAVSGLIGFVGLVVPHLTRRFTGPRHAPLLIASGLWGAVLLVVADLLCRWGFVLFSTELPVGVLTAFIGAPYFIYALRRSPTALLFG